MTQALRTRLERGFAQAFGGVPDGVVRAPGRINLIGEHTDYNDGFALPMAIDLETRIAWRRIAGDTITVVALDANDERDAFASTVRPEAVGGWRDYVRGSLAAMLEAQCPVVGAELAIAGTIPQGNGLSSSASLEIATLGALLAAAKAPSSLPRDVALLARAAENDFVGVNCGIMDQLTIACGEEGAALQIDCRSLEVQPVAISPDIAVLMVPSGVERGLVDGMYNTRREECATAARAMGVATLREADLALLARHRTALDPVLWRRAAHVVAENDRVGRMAEALRCGDLRGVGRLLAQSHASLRDLFEVSHADVDHLVTILQDAIGDEGGARMTGGGFGGAVVAIVRSERLRQISAAVRRGYRPRTGKLSAVVRVLPSCGAGSVDHWEQCSRR